MDPYKKYTTYYNIAGRGSNDELSGCRQKRTSSLQNRARILTTRPTQFWWGVGRSGSGAFLRLHPTLFCGALHLFLWIAPEVRRDVGTLTVVLFYLCLQSVIPADRSERHLWGDAQRQPLDRAGKSVYDGDNK